jgi:hypothetical protein
VRILTRCRTENERTIPASVCLLGKCVAWQGHRKRNTRTSRTPSSQLGYSTILKTTKLSQHTIDASMYSNLDLFFGRDPEAMSWSKLHSFKVKTMDIGGLVASETVASTPLRSISRSTAHQSERLARTPGGASPASRGCRCLGDGLDRGERESRQQARGKKRGAGGAPKVAAAGV